MASPTPSSSLPSPSLTASPSPPRALSLSLPIPTFQSPRTHSPPFQSRTRTHSTAIRADPRTIIPLDEFGFSNQGVLELNVTGIAFDPPPPRTSTSPSSARASSSATRDRLPSLGFRPAWSGDSDPGCRPRSSTGTPWRSDRGRQELAVDGKQKKKKWSKGKQKEKVNNAVLFDQATYHSEVPKYKQTTPSVLSERLRGKELVQLKCEAWMKSGFYVSPEAKLLFVV